MEENTIIIVILGHGEIPVKIVSKSETATRPTPKQHQKQLASTIPVETIVPAIINISEFDDTLNESSPGKTLNIVKYSYTEPGNCSVGTIYSFYRQFNTIIESQDIFESDDLSLIKKMEQTKAALIESYRPHRIPTLKEFTKFLAQKDGIKKGYDPIGTSNIDILHSIDRSGNIEQFRGDFIDKNYIFKQDDELRLANSDLSTFYKYGVYCAYSNNPPLYSPADKAISIFPYTTDLPEPEIRDITLISENEDDLNLSTIIEKLISLKYTNIGIFDFTCSNFKPIDAAHLGYNIEDRSENQLRNLRALTRKATSMAKMNEPIPTKRTATSMEDMDDSRPTTIMEDMDDSRPTKRAGGRRKTRKNRRKHKKTEKPNKKSNKKSIAFTP